MEKKQKKGCALPAVFAFIFILFSIFTSAYAAGNPSIQIDELNYSDSSSRVMSYDFSEGELIYYDPGHDGERLTLFLPDSSVVDPEGKTFYMRAWDDLLSATLNTKQSYLKFSIPNVEDCESGSVYGSFVLEQEEGYAPVPADEFSSTIKLQNFQNFNSDQTYYSIMVGFSSRWEYYGDLNQYPKYRAYIQLLVLNGQSSSGTYHDGTLLCRIQVKRRLGDAVWYSPWTKLGEKLNYNQIQIEATLQAGIENGIQKLSASCSINNGRPVELELDPETLNANFEDISNLDVRPFAGLASIVSLETGCLRNSDSSSDKCKRGTHVMRIDKRGVDFDHDQMVDIRYVSQDFTGFNGPFLATEGGTQCDNDGSGNRLSSISMINANLGMNYPNDFCDLSEAPIYIPGSDCVGTYFTYNGATAGETMVVRTYNGQNYYKIKIIDASEKNVKFIWSEVDPPQSLNETCTPGMDGVLEIGLNWNGPVKCGE